VTGPGHSGGRGHYSYTHYADPTTARGFDDRRFGGPIGELVASTQARVLTNMVGRIKDRSILDVGTGTGRAALLFARGGALVTGVDASAQMLAVARQRAAAENARISFQVMDAHALGFPDRAFDVTVSLRVLMHSPRWRKCIAELCRVAERLVILDYPAACSVALVQSCGPSPIRSSARVRSPRPSIAAASASGRSTASSSCRSRSTRRSARAGSRPRPRLSSSGRAC
jgi:SAM-dependent methyltransferase